MPDGEKSGQSDSTAFTLIELLGVIAIIAILAALLMAGLTKAKGQALSTYCKNNLRQQGIAIQMYVDDTKFYPYYSTWENSQWEQTLKPYYPTPDAHNTYNYNESVLQSQPPSRAYQCPAYTSMVPSWTYGGGGWWDNWSYGYNIWGSTHGSADVPNLDYCLGLGIDQSWLVEFMTGQAGDAPLTEIDYHQSPCSPRKRNRGAGRTVRFNGLAWRRCRHFQWSNMGRVGLGGGYAWQSNRSTIQRISSFGASPTARHGF